MLREHEKRFVNDDSLLKNTSIWKEKKRSWKSNSVHVQRLKLLVWKPKKKSRNTRKFSSYSSAKFCLFQTFCIISSVLFPFKLILVSLLTLPPNIQQLNIAWLMMRSTLHVSLYRKTLRITTMGDGRRGREKRGILKCSVVFNASNKEKKPSFLLRNSLLSCRTKTWKRKF